MGSYSGASQWRWPVAVLVTALIVLCVWDASWWDRHRHPVDFSGIAFNSMQWHVRVAILPWGLDAQAVQQALQEQLDRVDQTLSSWRADSELNAFNRTPPEQWTSASVLLGRSIQTALQMSVWSGGAYDVTVAPLVDLWGFGPKGRTSSFPTLVAIAAARERVGWWHLHVRIQKGVWKIMHDNASEVDLSSLGEGAGVDAMVSWLEQHGVHAYMVAVAGTLVVKGRKRDGRQWEVAIETPDATGRVQRVLPLTNMAVSTSGSYRNFFMHQGVLYSHTIDPSTGWPIRHNGISITVLVPEQAGGLSNVAHVDALATALNVLGPDTGWALAQNRHVAALYLVRQSHGYVEKATRSFPLYLEHQSVAMPQW